MHCASGLPGTGSHWPPGSHMPGWGWQHQPPRAQIKGKFWSHPPLLNPSLWVWGQGIRICTSTQWLSPSTLHRSLCLLLPPLCPSSLLWGGLLTPAFPSTLPGGLGWALAKFLLLTPETSPLTLSHWLISELPLRKHPPLVLRNQGAAQPGPRRSPLDSGSLMPMG